MWKEGDKSLKKQCGRDTNRTKKEPTIDLQPHLLHVNVFFVRIDLCCICVCASKSMPLPSRLLLKRDQLLLAHHRPQHPKEQQQAGGQGVVYAFQGK